jgi:mannose-6-phosphate isomerase
MSELKAQHMNYAWGKVGDRSMVYKLLRCSGAEGLSEDSPYAELWIGDHDKAPSILPNGLRLRDDSRYGLIKYLFKVLSVEKPLSIQVHPNKELAEELHKKDPVNYPDSNAKPEMAVFITKTTLLYGFRPYKEIAQFLHLVPELRDVVGPQLAENFEKNPSSKFLRKIVTKLLSYTREEMKEYATRLSKRINEFKDFDDNLIFALKAINRHFPGDVGIFFPFILNVVSGEPGTAIFISTGTLHCYLSGELYETMSVSDNVIRAGMTPKFIDIPSVKLALDFEPQEPYFIHPTNDNSTTSYMPPVPDFCIKTASAEAQRSVTFEVNSVTIVLVESGKGKINDINVKAGSVVVLQPGQVKITAADNSPIKCVFCHSID